MKSYYHRIYFDTKYVIMSREGNGTPFQYTCLENPMDREAWRAAVYGVAKSLTQLNDWTELNFTHSWFCLFFHCFRKSDFWHHAFLKWTAKEISKEVRVAPRRLTLHGGSDGKESTYSAGDWGSSPGSGRSPGEGHRYPFQYSSLENPMNRRGYSLWVLKSWTQWND